MPDAKRDLTWAKVVTHLKSRGVDTDRLVNISGAPVWGDTYKIYDIPPKQKDELNGTFAFDPDHSSYYKVIVGGETWVGNAAEKRYEIKQILTEAGLKDDESGFVPFNPNGHVQLTDKKHAPLIANLYGEKEATRFISPYSDTAHVIALGHDNYPPTRPEQERKAILGEVTELLKIGTSNWEKRIATPADYQSGKYRN